MTKQLSYDTLCLIDVYLEEALKELDRELWRAKRNGTAEKMLKSMEADRADLSNALDQVKDHETYIANYVS